MLRSIKQRKNMCPAGTTLHVKDNFPIRDRIWHFVFWHFFKDRKICSSSMITAFLLSSILTVIVAVSITMPKNVSLVVGVTIFFWFNRGIDLLA